MDHGVAQGHREGAGTAYHLRPVRRGRQVAAWQHDAELLASVPDGEVAGLQTGGQREGQPLQYPVPDPVTVLVVDLLEVVDVEHHDAERKTAGTGCGEGVLEEVRQRELRVDVNTTLTAQLQTIGQAS